MTQYIENTLKLINKENNFDKSISKGQKELKKITSSDAYKKADYKGKTQMLGGKATSGKDMQKKMGGGMMMKPMGYKKGTSVMARGCKLGRKKATKIT